MRFKKYLDRFLDSNYYMIAIAIIALVFWITRLEIVGMAVLAGIVAFVVIYRRDFRCAFVVIAYFSFVTTLADVGSPAFTIFVFVIAPVLGISFIYYFIRHLIRGKIKLTGGHLIKGMLIATLVSCFAGIGFPDYQIYYLPMVLGISLGTTFIYFALVNTAGGNLSDFIFKLLLIAGILIIAEMFVFYYREFAAGNLLESFNQKTIDLQWAKSNTIAVFLGMAIPFIIYKSFGSRYNFVYLTVAILFYIAILFTFSRGNILFVTLLMIPMIIYGAYKTRYKGRYAIFLALFAVAISLIVSVYWEGILKIFDGLIDAGFKDSGRVALYKDAIEKFIRYPLLGVGFIYDDGGMFGGNMLLVHNTILQLLASAGIIGFLGFIPFYYQRYAMFFRKASTFKMMAFFSVLVYELYGLMDVTMLQTHLVFFVMGVMVACEKEHSAEPVFRKPQSDEDERESTEKRDAVYAES